MFEEYIEQTKQLILNKIGIPKQYVFLDRILSNPELEPAWKTYFHAEVNWWIYEQQMLRKTNPNFDFSNPEFHKVLQEIDALCFKTARFDREGLKTLADSAAKTRLNLLLRPRTTLKWFVFRGEPTKSFKEILLRLDYLEDYRYLAEGFVEWAKEEQVIRTTNDIFSIVEFEKVIERIDNNKIFDLSPDGFLELVEPIYAFFNPLKAQDDDLVIPIEALIIFLDDKGITPISEQLEDKYYQNGFEYITRAEFLRFILEILEEMDSGEIREQTPALNISLPGENFNTISFPTSEGFGSYIIHDDSESPEGEEAGE